MDGLSSACSSASAGFPAASTTQSRQTRAPRAALVATHARDALISCCCIPIPGMTFWSVASLAERGAESKRRASGPAVSLMRLLNFRRLEVELRQARHAAASAARRIEAGNGEVVELLLHRRRIDRRSAVLVMGHHLREDD